MNNLMNKLKENTEYCENCGYDYSHLPHLNYCPECGAKVEQPQINFESSVGELNEGEKTVTVSLNDPRLKGNNQITTYCSSCKKEIKLFKDINYCPMCGFSIRSRGNINYCPQCGGEVNVPINFCYHCGEEIEDIIIKGEQLDKKLINKKNKNYLTPPMSDTEINLENKLSLRKKLFDSLVEVNDHISELVHKSQLSVLENIMDLDEYSTDSDSNAYIKIEKGYVTEMKLKDISKLPLNIGNLKKLKKLVINSDYINKLPEGINKLKNLKILYLEGSNLESLPRMDKLTNLEELAVYNTKLSKIDQRIMKLKKLKKLDLHNNEIRQLPSWINSLKKLEYLNVRNNKIKEVPEINLKRLSFLDVEGNDITKILTNLKSIKEFHYRNQRTDDFMVKFSNQLIHIADYEVLDELSPINEYVIGYSSRIGTEVVIKNGYVTKLKVNCKNIHNIPERMKDLKLEYLDLFDNKIEKIENLPNTLKELYIYYNKVTKIENLPNTLEGLNISNNKVTKIENLPNTLKRLDISNNGVTKIENLPPDLKKLNLSYNHIKIENLPLSLEKLVLDGIYVEKVEGLNLPNLRELNLGYCGHLKEINLNLPNLRKLNLTDDWLLEEAKLNLPNLEYLNIHNVGEKRVVGSLQSRIADMIHSRCKINGDWLNW